MSSSELEMKFDPKTVKHLGLKMYSTLPAAVSEIISNSYDAYAKQVGVWPVSYTHLTLPTKA